MTASDVCLRAPGWVGYGFVMWLLGYLINRWQSADQPSSVLVRPPRWVALLCGNPQRNGTVDVKWAGAQLTCFIPMVTVPLVCVLGLPADFAVALVGFYPFTLIVVLLVAEKETRAHKGRDAPKVTERRD